MICTARDKLFVALRLQEYLQAQVWARHRGVRPSGLHQITKMGAAFLPHTMVALSHTPGPIPMLNISRHWTKRKG